MASNLTLMTETELIPWIQRRLGSPALKVCLGDEQLADAVSEAKRWFAAKKGIDKDITIDVQSGVVEYDVPLDCDAVIDVSVMLNTLDISLVFAPNIFADERIPYNVFASPGSGGLYSSYVQALQYTEMAKRILSVDPTWIFFPYKKKLILLPNQKFGGKAFIEYKSNQVIAIEQLPERDHDLIKRFALAYAKRDIGNIFSRYSSWPTAAGQTQLNGPQLLAQAEAEFAKLEDEIAMSAMPMPFLSG